jgi:hypothetical protein
MTHKETVELKEFFQMQIDGLKSEMRATEKRIDERLKVYKDTIEYRLIHLNELRDMVNRILTQSPTHKELDLLLMPLREHCQHQAGERQATQEISNKWILVLAIAIPTIIALVLKFAA